jgi:excisionase family DNA binding protein
MYSVTEYAQLKGISRQAVLKQIKTGKLPAKKVGKTYVIESNDKK